MVFNLLHFLQNETVHSRLACLSPQIIIHFTVQEFQFAIYKSPLKNLTSEMIQITKVDQKSLNLYFVCSFHKLQIVGPIMNTISFVGKQSEENAVVKPSLTHELDNVSPLSLTIIVMLLFSFHLPYRRSFACKQWWFLSIYSSFPHLVKKICVAVPHRCIKRD